jgi:hypothetical protein
MIRRQMTGWKIGPVGMFLLGGLVLLMLLIVVLPDDVDLPDAAFHRGTGPVLVHAQVTSAPVSLIPSVVLLLAFIPPIFVHFHPRPAFVAYSASSFGPILLCSLRR